jgi:prolyl 4-hydroxylase
VQYYQINNQFKPHTDYFDPSLREWEIFAAHRGQRTWTVTIYLNDVLGGGHTYFPDLDISIAPQTGKALIWNNLLINGNVNPETLHQGSPVTRGEKYIITKWFRTRPQY